jgi:hypothetical protein
MHIQLFLATLLMEIRVMFLSYFSFLWKKGRDETLEKTEGTIKNDKYRETDNIGYARHMTKIKTTKTEHTMCWTSHTQDTRRRKHFICYSKQGIITSLLKANKLSRFKNKETNFSVNTIYDF